MFRQESGGNFVWIKTGGSVPVERLLSGLQYLPVIVHIPWANHIHSFIIHAKHRSRSGTQVCHSPCFRLETSVMECNFSTQRSVMLTQRQRWLVWRDGERREYGRKNKLNKMFTQTWNKITENRCLLSSLMCTKQRWIFGFNNNFYLQFKYFSG